MEVFDGGVEVSVEVDFVAVELEFRAIQKRFAACKPRHHFVYVLNEVQNTYHGSVRHSGGYVAGNRVGKRRFNVALRKLFRPRALAVQMSP